MAKELANGDPLALQFGGFVLAKTGIEQRGDVSLRDWENLGHFLERAEGAVQWWVGDWLNYGEGRPEWGEKYEQAISIFDRDYQTLANYKWVSKNVKFSLRRENLSYSHHKEIADLEPQEQDFWLTEAEPAELGKPPKLSVSALRTQIKQRQIALGKERQRAEPTGAPPTVALASYHEWLPKQPMADLLLTDPPYSTDIEDVERFAADWLPMAFDRLKTTGRAYVCIGAYPVEISAYVNTPTPAGFKLANILVWTYRNTLGPSPKDNYKLNWQAILYYVGKDAPPLDCPEMLEQFTVQDISAPDGRQYNRFHEWQKPEELADRFIRHSTKPGALVLDPFVCTGTFIVAAHKLGRVGKGCDISRENLDIAISRGCVYES